jgi:hypothetical protein
MPECKECRFFFPVSEDADDYEKGLGDCVREQSDDHGKFWSSRPVMEDGTDAAKCDFFTKKIG